MTSFIYGVSFLVVIVLIELWPSESDQWLVVFGDDLTSQHDVLLALGPDDDLVSIASNRSIVIEPATTTKPADYYQSGAIAVIKATAALGCSSNKKASTFRKDT